LVAVAIAERFDAFLVGYPAEFSEEVDQGVQHGKQDVVGVVVDTAETLSVELRIASHFIDHFLRYYLIVVLAIDFLFGDDHFRFFYNPVDLFAQVIREALPVSSQIPQRTILNPNIERRMAGIFSSVIVRIHELASLEQQIGTKPSSTFVLIAEQLVYITRNIAITELALAFSRRPATPLKGVHEVALVRADVHRDFRSRGSDALYYAAKRIVIAAYKELLVNMFREVDGYFTLLIKEYRGER
jgi:hypothetical protein